MSGNEHIVYHSDRQGNNCRASLSEGRKVRAGSGTTERPPCRSSLVSDYDCHRSDLNIIVGQGKYLHVVTVGYTA